MLPIVHFATPFLNERENCLRSPRSACADACRFQPEHEAKRKSSHPDGTSWAGLVLEQNRNIKPLQKAFERFESH